MALKFKIMLAAIALVAVGCLIFGLTHRDRSSADDSSTTTVVIPDHEATAPTTAPTTAPLNLAEDSGDVDSDTQPVDLKDVRTRAIAAVVAYSQSSTDETAEARTARLQAVSAGLSDEPTELSLPAHIGSVNWSARSGIVGDPYAAFVSQTPTTVTFSIKAQYWGSYWTPERDSQQAAGTWSVTVEHDGDEARPQPLRIIELGEPDFILR